jgi:formylglycine-generating enzyme required for sulfatase activity
MAGNILEWVNDWYHMYDSQSSDINPIGPDSGSYRGVRGGGWNFGQSYLRSADRGGIDPLSTDFYIGFRCAWSK